MALEARAVNSFEELVDSIRVKADQDLIADDKSRGRSAVISSHQLEHRRLVRADILFGVLNSSRLEERLDGKTGWSAGLSEDYHLLGFRHTYLNWVRVHSTSLRNGLPKHGFG